METLTLHKHRRTFTLGRSTLRVGRSPRHGEIVTGTGSYPVRVLSFRGLAVAAADVVRLDRDGALLPDGGPATWTVHRHSAEVARGDDRIVVRQSGFFRKTVTVEVTGVWAELDLVALTVCFAVVARERRRQMMIAAIAASSHG